MPKPRVNNIRTDHLPAMISYKPQVNLIPESQPLVGRARSERNWKKRPDSVSLSLCSQQVSLMHQQLFGNKAKCAELRFFKNLNLHTNDNVMYVE